MGADMVIYMLPACDLTDDRMEVLGNIVENLDNSELDGILEDVGLVGVMEGSRNEAKEAFRDLLTAMQDLYDSRQVQLWGTASNGPLKYPVLITGGLSFGDDPTEACSTMQQVGASVEIWDKLAEWAREDGG